MLPEPERVEDLFPPPHLIITALKQHTPPACGTCRSSSDLQKERWASSSLIIKQFMLFWSQGVFQPCVHLLEDPLPSQQ